MSDTAAAAGAAGDLVADWLATRAARNVYISNHISISTLYVTPQTTNTAT